MPEDEYISRNQEEINYFDLIIYTDIKRNLSIGDYIELITSKLLNNLGFCGKEKHLNCQWHKDIVIEEGKLLAETEKKIFNEFTKVKNLFERLDSLSILTLSSVDIFRQNNVYKLTANTSYMKITIEVNCIMKTKYKEYQYKILRKCGIPFIILMRMINGVLL